MEWKGSLNNVQTLDYPSTTHRANRKMIKRYAVFNGVEIAEKM